MFDEQPDADPHGECAAEIRRLRFVLEHVRDELQKPGPSEARAATALNILKIGLAPYGGQEDGHG
jgi:hypothetical protein